MNKDNEGVDVEDMYNDNETLPVKETDRRARPSASEVLIDIALKQAMTTADRRAVASGKANAIIVRVPDAGWVEPVLTSIAQMAPERMVKIARPTVPKNRNDYSTTLSRALSLGRSVAGASPDPSRAMPEVLISVCNLWLSIQPMNASMVMECIRKCQRGRVPAAAAELQTEFLSFEELTSLIGRDGRPADTVDRLKAAIEIKMDIEVGSKRKLPALDGAVEYSEEVRNFARDLRDDLDAARAGQIPLESIPRGVVFHGPSGTGKTLLAQMLGQACGIPTIVSSLGELFTNSSGYLDGMIKAQRNLFQQAKAKAPCVLFLDEINALPDINALGRNGDYWRPLILDFYTLLDSATSDRDGVIVVGATNRIEDINPALLRPGRLERAIYVGPPSAVGVERILRFHLGYDLVGTDLSQLAELNAMQAATGAVVMEQVRAARRIARRHRREMRLDDLAGQIVSKDERSAADLRRTAVHESGHVVSTLTLATDEVEWATILPVGDAGGAVRYRGNLKPLMTRHDYEHRIITLLSGRAAEEVLLGTASDGAGGADDSDLGKATILAASLFGRVGMGDSLVYRGDPASISKTLSLDRELMTSVDRLMNELYEQAKALLTDQRATLGAIAGELEKERFLSGSRIESIWTMAKPSGPVVPLLDEEHDQHRAEHDQHKADNGALGAPSFGKEIKVNPPGLP